MNTVKTVVEEWITSAQDDLTMVMLGAQVPVIASTCYHCGQAVEKILKAYIIAKENTLTKTHDLIVLLENCESHSSDFGKFKKQCAKITTFSTIRYPPSRNVTELKMEQTVKSALEIVNFTKSKLKDLGYEAPESSTNAAIEEVKEAIRVLRRQKSGAGG
jgi:HEPN domain-containing protein